MNNLRVAYYGLDRCGMWTVMLSEDRYYSPGHSAGRVVKFIEAGDEEKAKGIALSLKNRGEAQLVQKLGGSH